MTLLHIIPHRVRLSRDPLYTSFPCPAQMNTTVHFSGWLGLAVKNGPSSITLSVNHYISWFCRSIEFFEIMLSCSIEFIVCYYAAFFFPHQVKTKPHDGVMMCVHSWTWHSHKHFGVFNVKKGHFLSFTAGGQPVDASQEMIALGLCNLAGSFISAMPVTGSFRWGSPCGSYINWLVASFSSLSIQVALCPLPSPWGSAV